MLDKHFLRDFFRWLDSASDKELEQRIAAAQAKLKAGAITDPELVRDLKYLVKLMNRELAQHLFRSDRKKPT